MPDQPTQQQLLADLKEMEDCIAKTTSLERKQIFEITKAKILKHLEQHDLIVTGTGAQQPKNSPVRTTPGTDKKTIPGTITANEASNDFGNNSLLEIVKSKEPPMSGHYEIASPLDVPRQKERPSELTLIEVSEMPGGKQATIKWPNGGTMTGTEGYFRSRFTSALRDLENSTYARQERWHDLTFYVTFHRATAYYRAIASLWGRAPTVKDLNIQTSKTRNKIIEMILKTI